jgi:hypothetical protein
MGVFLLIYDYNGLGNNLKNSPVFYPPSPGWGCSCVLYLVKKVARPVEIFLAKLVVCWIDMQAHLETPQSKTNLAEA